MRPKPLIGDQVSARFVDETGTRWLLSTGRIGSVGQKVTALFNVEETDFAMQQDFWVNFIEDDLAPVNPGEWEYIGPTETGMMCIPDFVWRPHS
ncbi:MAG: hypothetical protein AAFX93_08075 [Verrucomicrobiota bacterium]